MPTVTHRFKIGDQVVMINDFGVCWGVKTITELDVRTNRPTYHYKDSDTPWFSVGEENLVMADEEDLKQEFVRDDEHPGWIYFQEKYGFTPTLEQLGGCY